jgi:hypothetical protein
LLVKTGVVNVGPVYNKLPPVAASYHLKDCPGLLEDAVIVALLLTQTIVLVMSGLVGGFETIKFIFHVFTQPVIGSVKV